MEALQKVLARIPKCHRWLLYKTFEVFIHSFPFLLFFSSFLPFSQPSHLQLMHKFDTYSEVTQMTVENLAIVLCPNLFRAPSSVSLVQSIKDTPFFLSLTKLLLEVLASLSFSCLAFSDPQLSRSMRVCWRMRMSTT